MKSATEKIKSTTKIVTKKGTSSLRINYYSLKCNNCDKEIKLSCRDKLKQKNLDELQERLTCNSCLDAKLLAKKG